MNTLRSVIVVAALLVVNAVCYTAAPQDQAQEKLPMCHPPKKHVADAPAVGHSGTQDVMLHTDPEAMQLDAMLTKLSLELKLMEIMKEIKAIKDKDAEAAKKKKEQTRFGKFAEKMEAGIMEVGYTAAKWGVSFYLLKTLIKYYGKDMTKAALKHAIEGLGDGVKAAAVVGDAVVEVAQESDWLPASWFGYAASPFWEGGKYLLS